MPKTWKDNVLSAIADAPTGVASLAAIKKATGVTASNRRFFDGALAKLVEEGALIKVKASYKLVAKNVQKPAPSVPPKAAEPKPTKPKNQTDQTKRKSAPAPPSSEDTASTDSMDDEPLQIGECAVVPGSGSYYEVTRDVSSAPHTRAPRSHDNPPFSTAHSRLFSRSARLLSAAHILMAVGDPVALHMQELQVRQEGQPCSGRGQVVQAHRWPPRWLH